jgi:hypothetical protein
MIRLTSLLLVLILSVGCATETSISTNLNEEFYKETVEVFSIYVEFVESGKLIDEQMDRKVQYYFSKYDVNRGTSEENEVFESMLLLKIAVDLYDDAYKSKNPSDKENYLKAFINQKNIVKNLLSL